MRIFLTVLAVGLCLALPDDADNKHYTQHRTSVDTARQGMQERLSKLEAQTSYQRQAGGNENYATGCTTGCLTGSSAYNTRSSSASSQRSSSNSQGTSDYLGVGIVGHNENSESDLQQRVSSRYSAANALETDDLQQRQVPDLRSVHSSAYRQSAQNSYKEEESEEDLQKNVGAGFHDLSVNNDRYLDSQSQKRTEDSRVTSTGGRTAPVYNTPGRSSSTSYRQSASNTESQYSETRTQKPVTVGQFVSMTVRPGTATVLNIPVSGQDLNQQRSYTSSNRRDYEAGSDSSRTRVQPGYQTNYYPSYSDRTSSATGSRVDTQTSRTASHQQPEKLITDEYSWSDEEETQQRVSPGNTGGSRYTSSAGSSTNYQQGYTSSRVSPVQKVESTSSQRTAEEHRRYLESQRTVEEQRRLLESQKAAEEHRRRLELQRTAEEQRRLTQSRPSYTYRTTANRNENDQSSNTQYSTVNRPSYTISRVSESDGSQYGSSGSVHYTKPVDSQTRSQIQSGSSSQTQYQAGSASQNQYQAGSASQNQHQAGSASQNQYQAGSRAGYGSFNAYPGYSRSSGNTLQHGSADSTQSRFNSQTMSSNSGDLVGFMSESERLARLQQNQVASSQSSTSNAHTAAEANRRTVNVANSLDTAAANFVGSNNLSTRLSDVDNVENLGGTGGYKRVKSWQKQSKWASGSEYGNDGAPKSYSMLSTAESEKHNINGAETGYKAATTTLENDGKVSTYSIHTP